MDERVRRWKLVEAEDGEFSPADILFIWVALHLYPGGCKADGKYSTAEKLLPLMKKVYDSFP
jgi:hypothetical protein